jgi:hypothetical protein
MTVKYNKICDLLEQMCSAGISGTYETLAGSGGNFFDTHGKTAKKRKKKGDDPTKDVESPVLFRGAK